MGAEPDFAARDGHRPQHRAAETRGGRSSSSATALPTPGRPRMRWGLQNAPFPPTPRKEPSPQTDQNQQQPPQNAARPPAVLPSIPPAPRRHPEWVLPPTGTCRAPGEGGGGFLWKAVFGQTGVENGEGDDKVLARRGFSRRVWFFCWVSEGFWLYCTGAETFPMRRKKGEITGEKEIVIIYGFFPSIFFRAE